MTFLLILAGPDGRSSRARNAKVISQDLTPTFPYHLRARGNNGQRVFLAATDYEAFLTALQTTRERSPFALYAYVPCPSSAAARGSHESFLSRRGHRPYAPSRRHHFLFP